MKLKIYSSMLSCLFLTKNHSSERLPWQDRIMFNVWHVIYIPHLVRSVHFTFRYNHKVFTKIFCKIPTIKKLQYIMRFVSWEK